MTAAIRVADLARVIAEAIELPEKSSADIDTVHALVALAIGDSWGRDDLTLVDLFSRHVDISGSLCAAYSASGRRKSHSNIADSQVLELAVAVLCRAVFLEMESPASRGIVLKRLNTLFKAMDLVSTSWLAPGTPTSRDVDDLLASVLREQVPVSELEIATPAAADASPKAKIRVPLTVLFWEGPIARSYLETLRVVGFKPAKIIHLIPSTDISTKMPVGRWLPRIMRAPYAYQIQKSRIHDWSKKIASEHPQLRDSLVATVEEHLGFPRATVEAANALSPLSEYCDNVETVLVKNLADQTLDSYLRAEDESAILFTGGGIVPSKLLSIPQLRFLHVHPGHLPSIRGADCLLWSLLLTGHPSATCFYMAPGLDTGDTVLPCWLPKISIGPGGIEIDQKTQYQAAYTYFDPWVRSFALRKVLTMNDGYLDMESTPQEQDSGVTFHFMHERLRATALEKLFPARS